MTDAHSDRQSMWQMPSSPPPTDSVARVLFLCVANSARSQMAEGIARARLGDAACVESAGSMPRFVHPLASKVLDELGIEHSGQRSKNVDEIDPADIDLVVTLCADEVCPVAVSGERVHWPLPDPAKGPDEGMLEQFRVVGREISARVDLLATQWLGLD